MSGSRLARLYRRLGGRPGWRQGRWWRTRRLAGTLIRLSAGANAGWHAPQPAQGPRPPAAVAEPRWALDQANAGLGLRARAVPQLATIVGQVSELKGLKA